jgi:peptide/nickel transport system substrate-binding protein
MSRLLAIASLVCALFISANAESRPRYGGSVRIETRLEWESVSNPARALVFETLTTVDDQGRTHPGLATSWESQADGRRWQFYLRRNIRFYDGTMLTPTTVVDALTAHDCDGCPWRAIRALPDSVTIEFSEGRSNFAAELALPRYALMLANSAGIGTGPFKLAEQRAGVVVLASNEEYWQGRPFLDTVEVTTGRSERDQALDLELGRTDLIEVGSAQLRRVQQQKAHLTSTRPADLIALRIRTLRPALQDPRFREAIAASVDRGSIHKVILQGEGEVTGALLPNWATGYAFLFPSTRELPRAQRLAKDLGPALPITISAENEPLLQLIAERIALNVRDAGFSVQLAASPDRADLVLRRVAINSSDPEVALKQIADVLSLDSPGNSDNPQKMYEQERGIIESHLAVPLVIIPRNTAASGRLRNWAAPSLGGYRLENVWVSEPTKP